MFVRFVIVAFSGLLLAGCVAAVPLHVERPGTLAAMRYDQFDKAAAMLPSQKVLGGPNRFPEPKWEYVFDAPFDPRVAPLQIGRFTGRGEIGERVAGNLPGQLLRTLGDTALFASVTLEPILHAFVLSGNVTRADDQFSIETDAATQVEAIVTRDGVALGAIQINAVQIGVMPLSPLMLLVSAAVSAGQGTRSAFVSERFADIFRSAANGAMSKAWAGGVSRRFMLTPATKT